MARRACEIKLSECKKVYDRPEDANLYIILDDTPTLLELKEMKRADGTSLEIIETIAAGDYMTVGILLLKDKNRHKVNIIEKNHIQKGLESVTEAIISKWLTSGAAPTRTYHHFIKCLRQSKLDALADNISLAIVRNGMSIHLTDDYHWWDELEQQRKAVKNARYSLFCCNQRLYILHTLHIWVYSLNNLLC